MPNGKPGDHPLTDILNYGHSEFGEPVDGFVKQLVAMPGFQSFSDEVAAILWEHTPFGRVEDKDDLIEVTIQKLDQVKQRIHSRLDCFRYFKNPRLFIVPEYVPESVPLCDKPAENMESSAPGRIRTCDTRFRKPMLYPLSYGGC